MKKMSTLLSHCSVYWIVALLVVNGVGGAPLLAQTADIQLVALSSPSETDTVAVLPTSESYFLNDAAFVIEMWAQTTDLNGLSSVSADIAFTATLANMTAITPSTTFNVLTYGTIDNVVGTVDDLSGSHLGSCADAVGVTPQWTRVATLNVTALVNGSLTFQSSATSSAIYGTAICGFGNLLDTNIVYGSVTVTLVDCLANTDCDDGQFCNGPETCDPITHTCINGTASCTDACEHCVEDGDTCEWCIFDLDGTGVMGTGDFGRFSPCFGSCYSSGDPCLASNFNEDPSGCVGTADFASFVGCFGEVCGDCTGCSGPSEGAFRAAGEMNNLNQDDIRVRVVPRRSISINDVAAIVPTSQTFFKVGDRIYIEIWTRIETRNGITTAGLASSYVDLRFDRYRMEATDVLPSTVFNFFTPGFIGPAGNVLRAIGGCTSPNMINIGSNGNWIRVATVVAQASSNGEVKILPEPSDEIHGFTRAGMFQNIDSSLIVFEGATIQIGKKHRTLGRR